jgi:hypothetical protein
MKKKQRQFLNKNITVIVIVAVIVICIIGIGFILIAPTQKIIDYDADSGYLYAYGWTYSEARHASTGTVVSPIPIGGSLIGQVNYQGGQAFYVYRTVLFFDTSVLDEGEIVEAAYLTFTGNVPDNHFDIVVQREVIPINKPLEPRDYHYLNFEGNHGSVNTAEHSGYQFEIQLSDLETIIDPAGFTTLILRSNRDIDGWQPPSDAYDVIHIENPVLTLEIANRPPQQPTDPYPADGANLIDSENDLVFTWVCEDPEGDSITYEFWFEEQGSELQLHATLHDETSYTLPASELDYNTYYQWQILASDQEFTTAGDIWTFQTAEEDEPPAPPPDTPGFEILTLIAAIGIGLLVLKRKKPNV